jgi:hypothetical protein
MTIEEHIADHGARIVVLEKDTAKIEGYLFALLIFMMGTFATSAGALLTMLLGHK